MSMIFVVLAGIVCIKYFEKTTNGIFENQYLYPKDLTTKSPIAINTKEEYYRVIVKPGQNLGCIVEAILDKYLLTKGIPAGSGKINIANAVYNLAEQVITKSGNSDLIFAGETLAIVLPKQFTIFQIDTVFETKYYDVEQLRKTLNSLYWLEPYKAGYFDCSNMSGFLSMWLIRQGWDAYIVTGQKYCGQHSWVQVRIDPYREKYVDIEATGLFIDNHSPKPTSKRYRPWAKIKDDLLVEYGWWHLDQPLMVRRK
jgi:hypothetical protein